MDIQKEASKLEQMSARHDGQGALKELQSLSKDDRLNVIKQMQQDARQEQGHVYIDNGQLVFDSPFNQAHREY